MSLKGHTVNSDKTGITSALLCTVHCMVIPALFLVKYWQADNNAFTLPNWWEKLDYVFLAISLWAVYHSAAHARFVQVKISLWFFWCLFALAVVFDKTLHMLAYVASAGLIVTHLINLKVSLGQLKRSSRQS